MGTRGTFGFFYKGKYYVCYNHMDSYPSHLGVRLILEIITANFDEWIELLEKMKIVTYEMEPTEEDIKKLENYTNLFYSSKSTDDWVCLLARTQGSFSRLLQSGYLINHLDENGQPEHEEYTYVLNFDEGTLDLFGYFDKKEEEESEKEEEEDLKWIKLRLDKDELLDIARKWSNGALPAKFDPGEELLKLKARDDFIFNHMKNMK